MPIDVHTAALIIGSILIVVVAVLSAISLFGKRVPARAGRLPHVGLGGLGLIGAALIAWALLTRPGAELRMNPGTLSGVANRAAPAVTGTGPAAVASQARPASPAGGTPAVTSTHARIDVVFVAGAAFDSCPAPILPAAPVPDGASATRAQMLAAQESVRAFDAATTAYTHCLNAAAEGFNRQYGPALSVASSRAIERLHSKINNSAVDADQALADKFNEQLHIFQARAGRSSAASAVR